MFGTGQQFHLWNLSTDTYLSLPDPDWGQIEQTDQFSLRSGHNRLSSCSYTNRHFQLFLWYIFIRYRQVVWSSTTSSSVSITDDEPTCTGEFWASGSGLPTSCGSVEASRSNMMVPFSMQVLSSIKLCKDSVATWGLLQRSPPSSTVSSNLIHLDARAKEECRTFPNKAGLLDVASKL